MASQNILLPVQSEVTLKVISRSNIDIILTNQHFGRRIERAGPMTFKVILKVTGVNFGILFNFDLHTQKLKKNTHKHLFFTYYMIPLSPGVTYLGLICILAPP